MFCLLYGPALTTTHDHQEDHSLDTHTYILTPGGSDSKESAFSVGDPGSILGQEDLLEKEMASYYSIPAWRILWTEEPGGLQSIGLQRIGYDWAINTHAHTHTCITESFCYTSETNNIVSQLSVQFSSVQSLSHVGLFATP